MAFSTRDAQLQVVSRGARRWADEAHAEDTHSFVLRLSPWADVPSIVDGLTRLGADVQSEGSGVIVASMRPDQVEACATLKGVVDIDVPVPLEPKRRG